MILVALILLMCIAGVSLNLHAARRLENRSTQRWLTQRLPTRDVDDIPSVTEHDARVIPCEVDDECDPDQGWMQTYSGRKFYPLAPRAEDVELADVAHGLAMVCRYGGHARQFYSVAEHCVLVSEFVEMHARNAGKPDDEVRRLAQLALMHDSAEAYIGDMIRPLKHQPEMAEFRRAEAAIEIAVAEAFHLRWTPDAHEIIKRIDNQILVDEISYLMSDPELYVRDWLQGLSPLGARFRCMPPAEAQGAFMSRYRELFT